jgi:hypothetical protein
MQGHTHRIIFREVAIKMPLSVALLFLPPSPSEATGISYTLLAAQSPFLGRL